MAGALLLPPAVSFHKLFLSTCCGLGPVLRPGGKKMNRTNRVTGPCRCVCGMEEGGRGEGAGTWHRRYCFSSQFHILFSFDPDSR